TRRSWSTAGGPARDAPASSGWHARGGGRRVASLTACHREGDVPGAASYPGGVTTVPSAAQASPDRPEVRSLAGASAFPDAVPERTPGAKAVPGRRILLAAPRGYCAGVDRAVDAVEKALEHYGAPIYVRKEIVHNKFVVETLSRRGAIFVEETDEVPEGARVVFSAHGVS